MNALLPRAEGTEPSERLPGNENNFDVSRFIRLAALDRLVIVKLVASMKQAAPASLQASAHVSLCYAQIFKRL